MNALVVELDRQAIQALEIKEQNPDYCGKRPCVLLAVGNSTPEYRYKELLKPDSGAGYKAMLRKYGLNLLPELYQEANKNMMSYPQALQYIYDLAIELRQQGYAAYVPKGFLAQGKVYVILLDSEVLSDQKFMLANPDYVEGKPAVYVGMTTNSPVIRFQQHKSGYHSNYYAHTYGLKLLTKLHKHHNEKPMFIWQATALEEWLAEDLRSQGYAVWQN